MVLVMYASQLLKTKKNCQQRQRLHAHKYTPPPHFSGKQICKNNFQGSQKQLTLKKIIFTCYQKTKS